MKRIWNKIIRCYSKLINWSKKLIRPGKKQIVVWWNEPPRWIRAIAFILRFAFGAVFVVIKKIVQWAIDWLKRYFPLDLTILLIFAVSVFAFLFWNFKEQEIVRNLILLIAGITGWHFLSRRTETAEQDTKTTEQGVTVERLTHAIQQLDSKNLSVRLGGILGLEQIAATQEEESKKIARILVSFIGIQEKHSSVKKNLTTRDQFNMHRMQHLDIEAAVNALARIASELDKQGQFRDQYNQTKFHLCDLQNVDLRGLRFVETDLSEFNLAGADMSGAWMAGAKLMNAQLSKSIPSEEIRKANLTRAFLDDANLSSASLDHVNLHRAQMVNAIFDDTTVNNTIFKKTNISNARLRNSTHLTQEQVSGAIYWKNPPHLPDGLQPPEEEYPFDADDEQ